MWISYKCWMAKRTVCYPSCSVCDVYNFIINLDNLVTLYLRWSPCRWGTWRLWLQPELLHWDLKSCEYALPSGPRPSGLWHRRTAFWGSGTRRRRQSLTRRNGPLWGESGKYLYTVDCNCRLNHSERSWCVSCRLNFRIQFSRLDNRCRNFFRVSVGF